MCSPHPFWTKPLQMKMPVPSPLLLTFSKTVFCLFVFFTWQLLADCPFPQYALPRPRQLPALFILSTAALGKAHDDQQDACLPGHPFEFHRGSLALSPAPHSLLHSLVHSLPCLHIPIEAVPSMQRRDATATTQVSIQPRGSFGPSDRHAENLLPWAVPHHDLPRST